MIYISILALIISVAAFVFPFLDKNNRRGYMMGKMERESLGRYARLSHNDIVYHYSNIPITWMYTAYHLRPELVNRATVALYDYPLIANSHKRIIVYVALKDFKMSSNDMYRLLIHDPTMEIWTMPIKLDREFIEKNLDHIIMIEAEVIGRNTSEGLIMLDPDSKGAFLFNPIRVEATNTPLMIFETKDFLIESR